jgi:ribosomal protein L16/L10AE
MGKGSGKQGTLFYVIKKGTILFEFIYSTILTKDLINDILKIASQKLSIPTSIYYSKIKGV